MVWPVAWTEPATTFPVVISTCPMLLFVFVSLTQMITSACAKDTDHREAPTSAGRRRLTIDADMARPLFVPRLTGLIVNTQELCRKLRLSDIKQLTVANSVGCK